MTVNLDLEENKSTIPFHRIIELMGYGLYIIASDEGPTQPFQKEICTSKYCRCTMVC